MKRNQKLKTIVFAAITLAFAIPASATELNCILANNETLGIQLEGQPNVGNGKFGPRLRLAYQGLRMAGTYFVTDENVGTRLAGASNTLNIHASINAKPVAKPYTIDAKVTFQLDNSTNSWKSTGYGQVIVSSYLGQNLLETRVKCSIVKN